MDNKKAFLIFTVFLMGCATSAKTPGEFRQAASSGAMGLASEILSVNRPPKDVAKTFDRKVKECLEVRVDRTTTVNPRLGNSSKTMSVNYRPTLKRVGDHSELKIQVQLTGEGILRMNEEPEGGYYVLLADVSPAGRSTSRVSIYYAKQSDLLFAAVKGWAQGNSQGCPDLVADMTN